jgi:hypothetical protein
MTDSCKVLMIFPLFNSGSFWNYKEACELTGARYPAAPLGLITVAAMLPESWDVRLVNRNTELLTEEDFAWADMVMGKLKRSWSTSSLRGEAAPGRACLKRPWARRTLQKVLCRALIC